ncbi:hypothetical protein [Dasineura jujubifolia toursvirus 2a]|nr:hypothetical protein [Dasineura jujubifolia toursvirus 2a]
MNTPIISNQINNQIINNQHITQPEPIYERDELYGQVGMLRMRDSFLKNNENSPQDRLVTVCTSFASNSSHAQRLYDYASKHWLSLSSPILGFNPSGKYSYPISCYLSLLPDNLEGIISTLSEVNHLSVCGGGVSIKMDLRSPSDKSMGVITHAKTYDSCVLAYKQGNRRGSYALYLDIDHPEILQFIEMRKPTGDYNMRCLNIHHAINISDKFMELIDKCTQNPNTNDEWDLIDPFTKKVTNTVSARMIWERIIETRLQTGEPYICFIDTCNKYMNPYQKEKGLKINQSNLCTEIIVPTNANRSSLCCLASVNMEYYDMWKGNEQFIGDVMEMLDNVLNVFTNKAISNKNTKKYFDRIIESATKERNIGIGMMGFHSYLQGKNLSIESEDANKINLEVFSWLKNTTDKYNKIIGKERGSPEDIEGSGNRFAYTLAVAPNATTSIIMGNTSPSIEPYKANVYRQDTLSGSQFNKNQHLEKLFLSKGFGEKLRTKIWSSIIMNDGSVQHLPEGIVSKHEKEVFKTFMEIDQLKLIKLASERQQFIDQGQSVTVCFGPDTHVKDLHKIHLNAWKMGLKTLYYCRSEKVSKADKLSADDPFSCVSCSS